MAEHGTRSRYNQGCNDGPDGGPCEACIEANRAYFRERHLRKSAEKLGVVPIAKKRGRPKKSEVKTEPEARELSPIELATLEVIDSLDRAKKRPDLAQIAMVLARDIGTEMAIAQRANLVARYQAVMDELTKGSERKSRLSAVRAMTRPKEAAG